MLEGGGTVLLKGDANWNAPGGATAYVDRSTGESLIIFHAQDLADGGTPFQWLANLNWTNDWPVIGTAGVTGSGGNGEIIAGD